MVVKKMNVKSNRPLFEKELKERIPVILEALAIHAEKNALLETNTLIYDTPESPTYKRTGRLRNSITHGTTEDKAIVGTNLNYAPYVELGTQSMPSRPFLRNAISKYRKEYREIIKKGMEYK